MATNNDRGMGHSNKAAAEPMPVAANQGEPIQGNGERCLNLCQFIGRLGRDPELKYVGATDPVALTTASLAVRTYRSQQKPDWIRLRFWRGAAEAVVEHARKGTRMHVTGKLRVIDGKDAAGNPRTYHVIDVDEFIFLGDSHAARASMVQDDTDLDGLDELPL
jgi:single-strand DNA-binding protein